MANSILMLKRVLELKSFNIKEEISNLVILYAYRKDKH